MKKLVQGALLFTLITQAGCFSSGFSGPNLLFNTHLSPAEQSSQRQDFLRTTPLQLVVGTQNHYTLNTTRHPYLRQPRSPVVHPYGVVTVDSPLSAQLSAEFRFNLPQAARDLLENYDLNQLDILFTVQRESPHGIPHISLKAEYWMFPHFDLNQVFGSPAEYSKRIRLAIFDADYGIQLENLNDFQSAVFGMQLHDQLVSPNVGQLNLNSVAPSGHRGSMSYSFYSVAIFESEHRAAVTLHWVLDGDDITSFRNQLQALYAGGAATFEALINELNDAGSEFNGTSLARRLNELTQI